MFAEVSSPEARWNRRVSSSLALYASTQGEAQPTHGPPQANSVGAEHHQLMDAMVFQSRSIDAGSGARGDQQRQFSENQGVVFHLHNADCITNGNGNAGEADHRREITQERRRRRCQRRREEHQGSYESHEVLLQSRDAVGASIDSAAATSYDRRRLTKSTQSPIAQLVAAAREYVKIEERAAYIIPAVIKRERRLRVQAEEELVVQRERYSSLEAELKLTQRELQEREIFETVRPPPTPCITVHRAYHGTFSNVDGGA